MTDAELIARLRQHDGWVTLEAHTHLTAADRIEALTKERDRLVKALQVYADPCDANETTSCGYEGNMCCRTARAALKGESQDGMV